MNIYTQIVMFMQDEFEPVYPGEISACLELHWFTVKKALDMLVKKGMVVRYNVPYEINDVYQLL